MIHFCFSSQSICKQHFLKGGEADFVQPASFLLICLLPFKSLPILLVMTWPGVICVDQSLCTPLRPLNVSGVGVVSYHLGLLLLWWHGGHIKIQFLTLSVAFCYFSKFRFDSLCLTQVKGARAFIMQILDICECIR
jgi:hypothetical protein